VLEGGAEGLSQEPKARWRPGSADPKPLPSTSRRCLD